MKKMIILLCAGCALLIQTPDAAAGDSVLSLSATNGYAALPDAAAHDLDYSKDFSVEIITRFDPHAVGGRWGSTGRGRGRR